MKHFLKLIETAQRDGVIIAEINPITRTKKATYEPLHPGGAKAFLNCQPFVFLDGETPFNEMNNQDLSFDLGAREDKELDAPFPVFSIECLNGPLGTFTSPDGLNETWCIIVVEISPKVYGYYALTKGFDQPTMEWSVWSSNAEGPTVKHYLQRLSKEQTGAETVRQIVKIGTGKNKTLHRIRRIIHVAPKKATPSYGNTRHVDWSHRFTVRGHWRDIGPGKIGKDRNGHYTQSGFTWVVEHLKGPENAPLVTKVRLVE